jgi:hypothetical protein
MQPTNRRACGLIRYDSGAKPAFDKPAFGKLAFDKPAFGKLAFDKLRR